MYPFKPIALGHICRRYISARCGAVRPAREIFAIIVIATLSQIKVNAAASSAARFRLVFRSDILNRKGLSAPQRIRRR